MGPYIRRGAQVSEEVPKVDVDFHPLQELGGALGLGMVGGGVAATNKILYRNDLATEVTVESHTPDKDGAVSLEASRRLGTDLPIPHGRNELRGCGH